MFFFWGQDFFTGGRGEEEIFFGPKIFFTGERGEEKIFFGPRIFLQEGEGGRRRFFSWTKDFFYREGRRFQKSSLLEIWREGGGGKHFFYREGGEGGPGKKTRWQRSFFFPLPAGFTVPTATSRLGEGLDI